LSFYSRLCTFALATSIIPASASLPRHIFVKEKTKACR
jgi:hypothetical protein